MLRLHTSYVPRFLRRYIRRKADLGNLPHDRYQVRVAQRPADYRAALELLHCEYARNGWRRDEDGPALVTEHHRLPGTAVLVAYDRRKRCVGTMSLVRDSAVGLPIEEYCDAIDRQRRPGRQLGEFGSLAIAPAARRSGLQRLMWIAAYRVMRECLEVTHGVIAVQPQAAPLYSALANFEVVGPLVRHPRLDVPAVPMLLDTLSVRPFIRRHYPAAVFDYFYVAPPPSVVLPQLRGYSAFCRWKVSDEMWREFDQHVPGESAPWGRVA